MGRGEDTNLTVELLCGIKKALLVLLLHAERRAGAQGLQPQPPRTGSPSTPTIRCRSSLLLAVCAELCAESLLAPPSVPGASAACRNGEPSDSLSQTYTPPHMALPQLPMSQRPSAICTPAPGQRPCTPPRPVPGSACATGVPRTGGRGVEGGNQGPALLRLPLPFPARGLPGREEGTGVSPGGAGAQSLHHRCHIPKSSPALPLPVAAGVHGPSTGTPLPDPARTGLLLPCTFCASSRLAAASLFAI